MHVPVVKCDALLVAARLGPDLAQTAADHSRFAAVSGARGGTLAGSAPQPEAQAPWPHSSAPRPLAVGARGTSTCSSASRQPNRWRGSTRRSGRRDRSTRLRLLERSLREPALWGHCAAGLHEGQCERLRRRRRASRSGIGAHNQALRCRDWRSGLCLAGRRRVRSSTSRPSSARP
jgi:hypothetical protein